jgi:hypothetical protein
MAAQDGNMIGVRLSSSDHLYLSQSEIERLADTLRHELICRTTTQADEPVVVVDVVLTVDEAWRLLDRLDMPIDEIVDWADEGF